MGVLRVASYNIRLGLEQGLSEVAKVLEELDAGLVALQEIGRRWTMGCEVDQVDTLARLAQYPFYAYCPTLIRNGHQLFGHALLSRSPLSELRTVDLARTRDEPRRLLVSTIEHAGHAVHVVSLHLSHLDDERPAQVEQLSRELSELQGPLLLIGDLNEPRPEQIAPMFLSHGLEDCGAIEGANTFPAREPRDRRDVIAVRGFSIQGKLEVIETLASDHRPIVVELSPSY